MAPEAALQKRALLEFEKGAHGEAAGLTRWYQQDATPHSATSGDGRGAQGQRRAVRAGSVRAPAPGWQHRPASGSTGCLTDRAKLWGQPGHPMAGAQIHRARLAQGAVNRP